MEITPFDERPKFVSVPHVLAIQQGTVLAISHLTFVLAYT
jgi:hypothetical protein